MSVSRAAGHSGDGDHSDTPHGHLQLEDVFRHFRALACPRCIAPHGTTQSSVPSYLRYTTSAACNGAPRFAVAFARAAPRPSDAFAKARATTSAHAGAGESREDRSSVSDDVGLSPHPPHAHKSVGRVDLLA